MITPSLVPAVADEVGVQDEVFKGVVQPLEGGIWRRRRGGLSCCALAGLGLPTAASWKEVSPGKREN